VLRFLQSSLLVTSTGCQVKTDLKTNGILAQKNWLVGAVEEKKFLRIRFLHRDFFALSSVEKITAAPTVQDDL
jgi:hypothetical protein